MKYEEFLEELAYLSNIDLSSLKDIMKNIPRVLIRLREGQWVRTPMGTFQMKRRKQKRIKLPGKNQWTRSHEKLQIHYKPDKSLVIITRSR